MVLAVVITNAVVVNVRGVFGHVVVVVRVVAGVARLVVTVVRGTRPVAFARPQGTPQGTIGVESRAPSAALLFVVVALGSSLSSLPSVGEVSGSRSTRYTPARRPSSSSLVRRRSSSMSLARVASAALAGGSTATGSATIVLLRVVSATTSSSSSASDVGESGPMSLEVASESLSDWSPAGLSSTAPASGGPAAGSGAELLRVMYTHCQFLADLRASLLGLELVGLTYAASGAGAPPHRRCQH